MNADESTTETPESISPARRKWVKALGMGIATAPLAHLLGCDGSVVAGVDGSTGLDGSSELDGGADSGSELDSGAETDSGTETGTDSGTITGAWATGGTAAMTAAASYPNPFADDTGSSCELQCTTTIGPCHTGTTERQDISDGWDGLPVRLALRVVDESCSPVEGVLVEIWHTNYHGIYSGEINGICNSAQEDKDASYFRGYQTSDSDGRVNFDTVFPGWYSSRAVHIHFRIQMGSYAASDSADAVVISQLFFSDELITSIFSDEPLYQDYDLPDTWLDTDNVIGGEDDKTPYICDVAQMSDGAMLASKTLIVNTSTGATCTASGSANTGGGGGGTPPGGF